MLHTHSKMTVNDKKVRGQGYIMLRQEMCYKFKRGTPYELKLGRSVKQLECPKRETF